MMRFPLLPTALVAAAVATMIGLGIWQLQRAREKDALAARYAQNASLAPMALTQTNAADETILFRRASAFCLEVTRWRKTGGKSASGKGGTRFIAQCRTGVEGPGFAADMGVSRDPEAQTRWAGGEVTGTLVAEPSEAGIFDRLTGKAPPPRPMIVSERPADGLEASARPTPDAPNNSPFYAFQWFFFALAAAAIYLLALRRRGRERLPPAA
jgi:cytochrome oxidase assembly protein ShyY1